MARSPMQQVTPREYDTFRISRVAGLNLASCVSCIAAGRPSIATVYELRFESYSDPQIRGLYHFCENCLAMLAINELVCKAHRDGVIGGFQRPIQDEEWAMTSALQALRRAREAVTQRMGTQEIEQVVATVDAAIAQLGRRL